MLKSTRCRRPSRYDSDLSSQPLNHPRRFPRSFTLHQTQKWTDDLNLTIRMHVIFIKPSSPSDQAQFYVPVHWLYTEGPRPSQNNSCLIYTCGGMTNGSREGTDNNGHPVCLLRPHHEQWWEEVGQTGGSRRLGFVGWIAALEGLLYLKGDF